MMHPALSSEREPPQAVCYCLTLLYHDAPCVVLPHSIMIYHLIVQREPAGCVVLPHSVMMHPPSSDCSEGTTTGCVLLPHSVMMHPAVSSSDCSEGTPAVCYCLIFMMIVLIERNHRRLCVIASLCHDAPSCIMIVQREPPQAVWYCLTLS